MIYIIEGIFRSVLISKRILARSWMNHGLVAHLLPTSEARVLGELSSSNLQWQTGIWMNANWFRANLFLSCFSAQRTWMWWKLLWLNCQETLQSLESHAHRCQGKRGSADEMVTCSGAPSGDVPSCDWIIACYNSSYQFYVNDISISCQWHVNVMLLPCYCHVNVMSMSCQCHVNEYVFTLMSITSLCH